MKGKPPILNVEEGFGEKGVNRGGAISRGKESLASGLEEDDYDYGRVLRKQKRNWDLTYADRGEVF